MLTLYAGLFFHRRRHVFFLFLPLVHSTVDRAKGGLYRFRISIAFSGGQTPVTVSPFWCRSLPLVDFKKAGCAVTSAATGLGPVVG